MVRFGKVGRGLVGSLALGNGVRATAGEANLACPGVGRFLVRAGREIVVEPSAKATEEALRAFLLGPVLAVALHQRGRLVLHASAVALDGGAVAFLGGSGWGKSTLAGALYRRGHRLIADDVLAVSDAADGPCAWPGIPQLKLWPDTAAALGDAVEPLPRLEPRRDKRVRAARERFAAGPLPLRRIYVLARGSRHAIAPLHPQQALVEILRHSYAARLLRAGGAATHFAQCARVAGVVPLARLEARQSLPELPALAQFIEEDCGHPA